MSGTPLPPPPPVPDFDFQFEFEFGFEYDFVFFSTMALKTTKFRHLLQPTYNSLSGLGEKAPAIQGPDLQNAFFLWGCRLSRLASYSELF